MIMRLIFWLSVLWIAPLVVGVLLTPFRAKLPQQLLVSAFRRYRR